MNIRPETVQDAAAIRALLKAAFADHPFSHQTEGLLVDDLRATGALSVALVAEQDDGAIVGFVAASPVSLDGAASSWYGLAPLAVADSARGQGVARALVDSALARLGKLGAEGAVVLGEPALWQRFGFVQQPQLSLAGVPPQYFLARLFKGEWPNGRVAYHPAFDVA